MGRVLVVVDYQKDFVDGALGFEGAKRLEPGILALVEEYVKTGDPVVFTLDTHGENYLQTQEGCKLPVVHCRKYTPGWALYGKTGKSRLEKDKLLEKPAFPSLELGQWLREKGYEQIELVGLVSYMCVLSNAVVAKAALPDAELIIDAACTAGPDPDLHHKALELMSALHMTVVNA